MLWIIWDRPFSINHFPDETKIRKVEMWFRKDDKAKRNQWAQEIQDHRFMIQEEVQAALQEHRTDSNVSFEQKTFFKDPSDHRPNSPTRKNIFFLY